MTRSTRRRRFLVSSLQRSFLYFIVSGYFYHISHKSDQLLWRTFSFCEGLKHTAWKLWVLALFCVYISIHNCFKKADEHTRNTSLSRVLRRLRELSTPESQVFTPLLNANKHILNDNTNVYIVLHTFTTGWFTFWTNNSVISHHHAQTDKLNCLIHN